jgi:hypothetical protein
VAGKEGESIPPVFRHGQVQLLEESRGKGHKEHEPLFERLLEVSFASYTSFIEGRILSHTTDHVIHVVLKHG